MILVACLWLQWRHRGDLHSLHFSHVCSSFLPLLHVIHSSFLPLLPLIHSSFPLLLPLVHSSFFPLLPLVHSLFLSSFWSHRLEELWAGNVFLFLFFFFPVKATWLSRRSLLFTHRVYFSCHDGCHVMNRKLCRWVFEQCAVRVQRCQPVKVSGVLTVFFCQRTEWKSFGCAKFRMGTARVAKDSTLS